MYRVELGSDDFDGNSDAIKVANVVRAIAKLLRANGSPNKFQAERDAWKHIYTGITEEKLHPFNPANLELCSADNCTDGVVRSDELVEWGQWCKRFEFIDVRGEEEKGRDFGYHAAIARDHGSINWKSWSLPYWTPRETACLMVELDPQHYDSVKSSRNPQDGVLSAYVDATERMATREQESGLLPDKASPSMWLEWAQSKGRMVPDQIHKIARAGLPPPDAPAAKGKYTTPGDDWKEKARTIADECFDHDTNATPTVRDSLATKNTVGHITGGYCFRVMVLMQERGIKGARGTITNPATIMREALQGDKWWANKSK